MGSRPARITREEILTPPEFQGLRADDHAAGRVGGARIELVRARDETRLGYCHQQIPLRLMPPFSFDREPAALLYLINLTAGLLDGDAHKVEVTARQGTRALMTGQSATRIHPALSGFATQQWDVKVEDDACLVVLPGPNIPYQGCRYYQRGRVEVAPGGRLIWGDIWLPGRYDRGELSERFVFDRIIQDFEARRDGRLVYRDRFQWKGPWSPDDAAWFFGGELAAGSLFIAGPLSLELTEPCPGVKRSVFRLDSEVSCMRWIGTPAAVTADLVHQSLAIAASWTGGADAPPWFLGSSDLAPNHWFSKPGG